MECTGKYFMPLSKAITDILHKSLHCSWGTVISHTALFPLAFESGLLQSVVISCNNQIFSSTYFQTLRRARKGRESPW